MAKYTYTLWELVEEDGLVLFDFDYNLPNSVDKELLEAMFYRTYYFREIGSETKERWLIELHNTWHNLCYKYQDLFRVFEDEYLKTGVLNNNDIKIARSNIFQDTPQTQIGDLDFATAKTNEESNISGMSGNKYKYELLSEYASKIRHIYYEMIADCEPLFMQVF